MGRKVFISFLGTGNYVNCHYEVRQGVKSKPVRFVQEALINDICTNWTEDDKIFIYYTEESYKKNWLDNGHVDPSNPNQNLDDIEKVGLETRLKNSGYMRLVESHFINEGYSEDETWGIFDEVYSHLCENDEVYFDVTHAFRSIPMFSTVLFNYSSYMKSVKVRSIHYGAFEKLGPSYKVKNTIPLEERIAPVLNLTNVLRLQQYTDIASSFTTYGRVRKLSDALKEEGGSANSVVRDVYTALEIFDNALLTNRMSDIEKGKFMLVVEISTKAMRRQEIPTPVKDIYKRIKDKLKEFGFVPEKSLKNIEAAISWAKYYKMLPQAYTMGQEYIITLLYNKYECKSPYGNNATGKKDFRMYLSSLCSISDEDVENRNFRGVLAENLTLTDELLEDRLIVDLRPHFSKLGVRRNAVNHGKGNVAYEDLVEEFDKLFNSCMECMRER